MPNVENHEWSYINVPGKTNLVHKTVGQLVTESAKIYGEKEAVVFLDQNIRKNFLQINEEANKMAAALLSIGLQPGDRLAIWGPNVYEWYLTQWATAKAGIILVMKLIK